MFSRIYLLAGALCVSSYALAVTPSIGSVTARGEAKIDNHVIAGSGTVFDGSVVETGQSVASAADLRLTNNVTITLQRDSLGTLYNDHFMLQRGTAELGSTDSFRVLANDVVVVPTQAHSSGLVSIDAANAITVEANNGTLEIKNSAGAGIALVRPGHPLTLSALSGKSSAEFSATGTVSSENGHYYLDSAETGLKYEVKGDNLQSFNGASVLASGLLAATASPAAGVAGVLQANSIHASSSFSFPAQSNQSRELVRGFSISPKAKTETSCANPVDCCPGIPFPKCCPGQVVTCNPSN